MELDFPIEYPAQTFNQASGLVVRLPNADNLLQGGARGHSKGILVNDLIAGVQFGHDKMNRGAIG